MCLNSNQKKQTMCRFIISFILVAFGCEIIQAQEINLKEIDAQLTSADTLSPKDRNKVYQNTIIKLMYAHTHKAIEYSIIGLKRSTMENDTAAMAAFANMLGVGYHVNTQRDSSVLFLRMSIAWAKISKDERRGALAYFALANTFSKAGMPDSAINCFYAVLPYFEKQNDYKSIGATNLNIAVLYYNMTQYDKAKGFYVKALECAEKANDPTLSGSAYRGVGMYETDFKKKIGLYKKALEEFRKAGNKFEESITLATTGWDYYVKGDSESALNYLLKALKISEEFDFKTLISDQSGQLADVYLSLKNVSKAESYALKAEQFADKKNQILMQRLEEKLLRLYILKGDVEKAMQLYNSHIERIVKQNDAKMLNTLSENEVRYETEKKELRIRSLEKERRFILFIAFLGVVLLVAIIILIIARQKVISQKRKIAEQKIIQLEKEKQLVATHALLEGETTERTRLSKDLHDGLGGLLSVTKHKVASMKGSLTIPDDQVETFNTALEMLDSSIKELRRVAHNLMPESLMRYGLNSAINDFCESIDNVNYNFYGIENRLDSKLEVTSFRVVSELVNNALKHSKASIINVQFVQEEERISMTVYDNGIGFNPDSIDRTKSSGLNNIESRVLSFNGRIDIFSAPAKGTEVSVEFKF